MRARGLILISIIGLLVAQGCQRRPGKPAGPPAPGAAGGRAGLPVSAREVGATGVQNTAPSVDYNLGVTFGKELLLVGFNVSPSPMSKGEPATIEAVWKCLAKPSRNWTTWTHLNFLGSPPNRYNGDHPPSTPTSRWEPGKFYVDPFTFVLPEAYKGGAYQVSIGLYGMPRNWTKEKPFLYLPETIVAGGQRVAEVGVGYSGAEEQPAMRAESKEPRVAEKLSVAFGDEMVLVGYNVQPSPVQKGDPATLEIVWKCLTRPSRDWTVWTHIGPSQMINRDHRPALPIALWKPGKYYRDKVSFTVPPDKKPGQYPVSIGLYAGAGEGQPTLLLPEKVLEGGKRQGVIEVGFSAGR